MEKGKYLSGIMAALSTMVTLEVPHINVMTKVDVLSPKAKEALEEYVDPSNYCKIEDKSPHGAKYTHLANQLFQVIEDFSLVTFYPLDRSDESSVEHVVAVGKIARQPSIFDTFFSGHDDTIWRRSRCKSER